MLSNDLNLNEFLMPKDSPITTNQGQLTSFNFDAENEAVSKIRNAAIGSAQIQDASIGTAQIIAFNFNQGTGGTITLGGSANGDGVMQVLNASGGTVVRVNNQGITVTGGSITVINAAGGTIVDPTGLVSAANFISGQGSSVATGTLTSTTFAEVPNGSTGASISLTRSTQVQINAMMNCYHVDFDGIVVAQVFDGTTAIGPQMVTHGFGPDAGGDTPTTTSMSYIQTMAAGTRNVHLKVKQNNSPGTAFFNVGAGNVVSLINYVILGN